VEIDLVVRGICCLRPGLPGLSDRIRVRSIVDRFLEHSRIYVFGLGEEAEVFLSSADWMPRNFFRRVEVMFPIESPVLKDRVLQEIVPVYLQDTVKARLLNADGSYTRAVPAPGETPCRAQETLLKAAQRVTPPQSAVSLRPAAMLIPDLTDSP
jgi:polyphosphate kinase